MTLSGRDKYMIALTEVAVAGAICDLSNELKSNVSEEMRKRYGVSENEAVEIVSDLIEHARDPKNNVPELLGVK